MPPAPRFQFWLLSHFYHFVIFRRDGRLRQRSLQPSLTSLTPTKMGSSGSPERRICATVDECRRTRMLVNRLVLASICPWSFHENPNTLTQVASHFAEVFDFIDAGRNSACGAVLVHCFEGKNRTWVERGFHVFSIKKLDFTMKKCEHWFTDGLTWCN